MITKELYFNGIYIDLMPNTVIAVTFQAGDIGDLRTRAADYTQTVNIPKTNRNRQTFGNIDIVNSRSTIPYRKGRVDYYEAGLNIVTGGTGVLTEASDFYKLSIYNGVIDFFGAIDGKNVDDIDFEVYETIDDAYIESIRLSTGLVSAPVIDFGTLFPHPQELKNTNFLTESDWSNEGTGVEWDLGIAFLGDVPRIMAFFTDSTDNNTAYYTQDYKFFKDFKYRISFSVDVPIIDPSGIVNKIDLYIGTGASRQLIGSLVPFTTTGSYLIDETFIAGDDYDTIEIYAEASVADPGESARIRLDLIKVTDIAGIIDIKAPYYVPLISYSQIIEKIIFNAGYTLNLGMTNQAYYEKLYITFSKAKYEYPDRLIDKMKFRALGSGSQVLNMSDGTPIYVEFTNVIENGLHHLYNDIDTYLVPSWPYSIEYVVKARIIIDVTLTGSANVDFYFPVDGVTGTIEETVSASSQYVFTFDSAVMVSDATSKFFNLVAAMSGAGTATVEIIEAEFWVEIEAKAFDVINLSALILPTKAQKDFMKDFMMRFGILVSEKNKVLTMVETQKTIGESYLYVDWTAKRDPSVKETIKFDPKNYAQENIFRDITSSDALFLGSEYSIDVDDETLSSSKIFFTSIMAAVQQNNNNGMRLCRVELFDRTDNSPTYISSPTLLYLRENKLGDSEVMYAGDVKSSFLVCVYNDPLFEFNTTWEYFLKNYYPLISAALQRSKTVTRGYNLLPLDIAKLNMFRLMRDESQVYIINKVDKYVAGQVTKVEIFKVL